MGNIFAASEVLEIAIQIEKNGRDFYGALGVQAKEIRAKDIFKFLSQEEEKHLASFQQIIDQTDKYDPQGLDVDQYVAYMNALAGESVFTQKDKGRQLAAGARSEKEAIDIGIKAEKDSIIFYEGMKKAVPVYDQKIIDEVIAQEQGHLRQLMELKKNT